MLKLFFDTETNSRGNFKLPADDPCQPKIVQLAMVLTDENCNEISFAKLLVKPEGFVISEEVTKIHGITHDFAVKNGLPLRIVMGLFYRMAEKADTIHAFNIAYDSLVIQHEMPILKNMEYKFKEKERCEMMPFKNLCKLPGKYGDYKFPKLQEAYKFCFGKEFDGAHDSLSDVKATIAIHNWRINNIK